MKKKFYFIFANCKLKKNIYIYLKIKKNNIKIFLYIDNVIEIFYKYYFLKIFNLFYSINS